VTYLSSLAGLADHAVTGRFGLQALAALADEQQGRIGAGGGHGVLLVDIGVELM
jgi:L-aminopeptidase/D-esterase-like protein